MIKSEIRPALEAMRGIEINKIKNVALRAGIEKLFFRLSDARREMDAAIEKFRELYLDKFKEQKGDAPSEFDVIERLQAKLAVSEGDDARSISREILSHEKYFDEQNAMNKKITELLKEQVDNIVPINRADFMEAMKGQEKFTLAWVEAMYPCLTGEETKPKKENKQ